MAVTLTRAELISRKITSLAAGEQWLRDLVALGLMFHLEDDPGDVVNGPQRADGTWDETFSRKEAAQIRLRQNELYAMTWPAELGGCPIGFMMQVEEETKTEMKLLLHTPEFFSIPPKKLTLVELPFAGCIYVLKDDRIVAVAALPEASNAPRR